MFQRDVAVELRPLMRKDCHRLSRTIAFQEFADHAKPLTESYKATKATSLSYGSYPRPTTRGAYKTEKGALSRSANTSKCQFMFAIEDQEWIVRIKATKADDVSKKLS